MAASFTLLKEAEDNFSWRDFNFRFLIKVQVPNSVPCSGLSQCCPVSLLWSVSFICSFWRFKGMPTLFSVWILCDFYSCHKITVVTHHSQKCLATERCIHHRHHRHHHWRNDVKMRLSQCADSLSYWRIHVIPPTPAPKLYSTQMLQRPPNILPLMLQKIKSCELLPSAKPWVYFFPLCSFCWIISQENETQDKSTSAVSGRTNGPMCYSMIRPSVAPQDLIFAVPKSAWQRSPKTSPPVSTETVERLPSDAPRL